MRFLVLLVCLINSSAAQTIFDLQGHRGGRGLMPENTVPAFLKALDLGVKTLEMDVVISKDRQVVVSHEPYFSAAYSISPDGKPVDKRDQKKLVLYHMDYVDIRQYDVGSNGNSAYPEQQKIKTYKPLLSEVIEQAEAYRKKKNLPIFSYSIEIKSEPSQYNKSQPEPAAFGDLVEAVIRKQSITERTIIQSFDFAVLKHWKQQVIAGNYANVRLSALVASLHRPEKSIRKLGFKPDIYSPHFRLLNKAKIARLHEQTIKVIPWTVNKRRDMLRLKEWGVDGLITDYPNRASGL
ncbi:glycerophosphodiester phosphodiesterase family protein [Spirosoma validum]|uniref:Glycerophosphodiester phosphodiesterase n=1 Tax=Spirosoma validum TaxID=2771355 RepID=A0A927B3M7_9BACT|nr:glycerophosphodiester phosphodiesterase family protein [Spirosoma validum]MBD2754696.1 glycerophosphodiester phosphodiesterase [Spirosoma validum]